MNDSIEEFIASKKSGNYNSPVEQKKNQFGKLAFNATIIGLLLTPTILSFIFISFIESTKSKIISEEMGFLFEYVAPVMNDNNKADQTLISISEMYTYRWGIVLLMFTTSFILIALLFLGRMTLRKSKDNNREQ